MVLSRDALRASADATATRLGGPGQWLLNLPPTYVAGLQVLFRSVRAGTSPVVQDGSFVEAVAAMTGERRYVSLVPTQLHRMLDEPAAAEALGSFTAVLVGGAAVPQSLRDRAFGAGIRVVATYGMSETCGGCVYDGVPLDGVEVDLDAESRVRLRGTTLFDGYEGRPDLTDEVAARRLVPHRRPGSPRGGRQAPGARTRRRRAALRGCQRPRARGRSAAA